MNARRTKIVRTLVVPPDAQSYVVRDDVRDEYEVGPALLVCVDVRGVGARAVRKYAAIALVDGELRVDVATAFEDTWSEVVEA